MSITAPFPIKFECTTCHAIYMHLNHHASAKYYPCCPLCQKNGLLLGTADAIDALKHPKLFIKSYFNFTLQMLDKIR